MKSSWDVAQIDFASMSSKVGDDEAEDDYFGSEGTTWNEVTRQSQVKFNTIEKSQMVPCHQA